MSIPGGVPRDRTAAPARPAWRGWLHLSAAPVAAIAGGLLVWDSQRVRWASAVYACAATALFAVSALYHRRVWGRSGSAIISRLDHSMIFVIIAGTYTPVTLAVLPEPRARSLLLVVWFGALLGVLFRVLWFSAPRWLYTPLYLLLGWAAVPFYEHFAGAGPLVLSLILAGGLCYTAGAIVYALRRPDPLPAVFGFHEVFHTLTIAGWALHLVAIWLLVT